MIRKYFQTVVLITLLVAAVALTVHSQDDEGSGLASEIFDFPREHHLQFNQEVAGEHFGGWLYFTGILTDEETGDLYGYEFTLFEAKVSRMGGIPLFLTHAAISDVSRSQHPFYEYTPLIEDGVQAVVSTGSDDERGDFWRYEDPQLTLTHWEELDTWSIVAEGDTVENIPGQHIALNLTLVNDKADYYLHRPDGLGGMGACPSVNPETMEGLSYYYSHPALTTTGTLTIDDREVQANGDTWFDHQWGNFNQCDLGWDWFSFRMDDGSYMMLFRFHDENLAETFGLTYIAPDGNVQWWLGGDAVTFTVTRWWRSDLFGIRYPLEWIIETPVGAFALEAYFDEQTMVSPHAPDYWEGIMRVREGDHTGPQIGMAFIELADYPAEEEIESP